MRTMRPIARLNQQRLRRGVRELVRTDDALAQIIRDHGYPPLWLRRPGFSTLIRIMLEQQVSLASGAAAYQRLSAGVGRVTPRLVLEQSESDLRRLGLTRQKARYCRELADAIVSGRLDLGALEHADADEIRAALMQVPGIGPWTADVYLLNGLGRPDIWPRGDLALYQSMRAMLKHKADADAATLDSYADRWAPWRAVAARLLWHRYLCVKQRGSGTP